VILPPRGEDLILPALAPQQDGRALLVSAVSHGYLYLHGYRYIPAVGTGGSSS